VIVHGRAVARLEVEHPGAKILGFEQVKVPEFFLARLVDLPVQAHKIHDCSSLRAWRLSKLSQAAFELSMNCNWHQHCPKNTLGIRKKPAASRAVFVDS
jgi:hypothetical protein